MRFNGFRPNLDSRPHQHSNCRNARELCFISATPYEHHGVFNHHSPTVCSTGYVGKNQRDHKSSAVLSLWESTGDGGILFTKSQLCKMHFYVLVLWRSIIIRFYSPAMRAVRNTFPCYDGVMRASLWHTQIARFVWPTWGPPGSWRPQGGPKLAPWTLLSG